MKKRLLSLLCIVALCLTLLPAAALAADGSSYLALGDSITTGYAPGGKVESSFADQVAAALGYTLDNKAVDGETSATLLAKLQNGTIDVSGADLITITIGGNDLMNALYDYLAATYAAETANSEFGANDAQNALMHGDLAFLNFAAETISGFAGSEQASKALTDFGANLTTIATAIKAVNPDVTLLVATQYNPYSNLSKTYGSLFQQAQLISGAFDTGVTALNAMITGSAYALGFTVVDVYTAFEAAVAAGSNPCNPSVNLSAMSLNLDFHPNQTGHDLIAQAVHDALPVSDSGTVDTVFAPDEPTSRAMVVSILWRLAGSPVVNYLMTFDDVAPGQWYTEAVRWAASTGVTAGYNSSSFGPDDSITREQLAAMLWRFARAQGADVSIGENTNILSYIDAFEISEWAIPAMQWACGAGVLQDDSGALNPAGTATRAETAQILMLFCKSIAT